MRVNVTLDARYANRSPSGDAHRDLRSQPWRCSFSMYVRVVLQMAQTEWHQRVIQDAQGDRASQTTVTLDQVWPSQARPWFDSYLVITWHKLHLTMLRANIKARSQPTAPQVLLMLLSSLTYATQKTHLRDRYTFYGRNVSIALCGAMPDPQEGCHPRGSGPGDHGAHRHEAVNMRHGAALRQLASSRTLVRLGFLGARQTARPADLRRYLPTAARLWEPIPASHLPATVRQLAACRSCCLCAALARRLHRGLRFRGFDEILVVRIFYEADSGLQQWRRLN